MPARTLLAMLLAVAPMGCGKPEQASPGSTVRVRLPPARRVAAAPGFSVGQELASKAAPRSGPPVE